MLFKSVPFVLALLAGANAAPGSSSLLHHKKCDVSVMKQFDIANGTDVIISEDPLVPFVSPKLSAVNETAWESWFFDATADDGETGIGIMFWRDNSHVGEVNPPFGVLRLQTQVTFSNGSSWIEVSWVTDNTISTCKNSTTGVWSKPGYRYSFDISSDLKYTTIVLDSPTLKGTYTLTATAPAVYADGNQWPSKNASPQVKPWVYWEAPVTAGKVAVDFDIDGTRLNFTGVGGHDRNWGPFPLSVSSLGWQIGRVFAGPYTAIFWRIGSSVDGKTYLASVLIKSGEVIFSTRNLGVVKRGDYLLFSQTHVNHTGTPFDPSKARTTFTLDFTSAKKKKNWKFDVNFADPEWALGERGFGGFVPAQIKGGEVGCEVFSGIGTAMHAEFDDAWA